MYKTNSADKYSAVTTKQQLKLNIPDLSRVSTDWNET